MGLDEVGTARTLREHRKVTDALVAKHGGRLVKTTGDGVLLEFPSVVDAVECAVAVQAVMAERNQGVPEDRRMLLRIGINLGDILIEGDDILGDGVNVAARLEGIAEPGGICISSSAYDQVCGKVDVDFADLGERNLKNISRPVRAYAVRLNKSDRVASPPSLAPRPRATASFTKDSREKPLALPDKPSIAVLPFQNMSGDPDQEYFADGIVEEIITALSRFKSLFVIARNSSFTYKGKSVDIKQVGRELGVQYVLEGSVRIVGEKVRITTQLIDAASGSYVWADRFDGSLHDVFEMQDSVTARVVGSIGPTLSEAEMENVSRKPIENWSSYDYYLRGQKLYYEGIQTAQVSVTREALEMYRKAVDLDPMFGRACARVAQCIQVVRDVHGYPMSEEERAEALRCAELAIQLSGDDEVALTVLVFVFAWLKGDYDRGAELADRALALNPNWSQAWNARGIMSVILGEHERALDAFANAMRLNPIDKIAVPFSLFGIAAACSLLGRYVEGAASARKVLVLQPNDIRGLFTLISNTYLSGQLAEAEATVALIKQYHPHLRSSRLRQIFHFRRPEDMAAIERVIAFIGLSD
jgi:adenylate cyclase